MPKVSIYPHETSGFLEADLHDLFLPMVVVILTSHVSDSAEMAVTVMSMTSMNFDFSYYTFTAAAQSQMWIWHA